MKKKKSSNSSSLASPPLLNLVVAAHPREAHLEMEGLHRTVFPEIMKICEARGILLRIFDSARPEADQVSIEEEVFHSEFCGGLSGKTIFISILGKDYGPAPKAIPQEVIQGNPWISNFSERSLVELQILRWVLNPDSQANKVFFYFQGSLAPDSPSSAPDQKMQSLRQRIQDSGFPFREGFQSSEDFLPMAFSDLSMAVESLFPIPFPQAFFRQKALQESFLAQRQEVFAARPQLFKGISQHCIRETEPIFLVGETGIGKSALLANWVDWHRKEHPDHLVIAHFSQAAPSEAMEIPILRFLLNEIKINCGLPRDVPLSPPALRREFPRWLHMAGIKQKTIVVLDGLSLFEEGKANFLLEWLEFFPAAGISLILSQPTTGMSDSIHTRPTWTTVAVPPLTEEEKTTLIGDYIAHHGFSLTKPRIDRLVDSDRTSNPLFLTLCLKGVHAFGKPENFGGLLNEFLGSFDSEELMGKILQLFEREFHEPRAWLVRDSLTSLWASRSGLSEDEMYLLAGGKTVADHPETSSPAEPHDFPATGSHGPGHSGFPPAKPEASSAQPCTSSGTDPTAPLGGKLKRSDFGRFFRTLKPFLHGQHGVHNFFHDVFRNTVQKTWLFSLPYAHAARNRLLDLFSDPVFSFRHIHEFRYQAELGENWEILFKWLSQPETFEAFSRFDLAGLVEAWEKIEKSSRFTVLEAYSPLLLEPNKYPHLLENLGIFLLEFGHGEKARSAIRIHADACRREGDQAGLERNLVRLGRALFRHGEFEEAATVYTELSGIQHQKGDTPGEAFSLLQLARITYIEGWYEKSAKYFLSSRELFATANDPLGLERCIGSLATATFGRSRFQEAMDLFVEQETLCRANGIIEGLAGSLLGQALILKSWGDLDRALELMKTSERICRQINHLKGLPSVLNNQAAILRTRGDLSGALALFQESEGISHELGDYTGLQFSLGGQASLARSRGNLDEALRLFREQERICRTIGSKEGLQIALGGQSAIHQDWGRLKEAMDLSVQAEKLCRELEYQDGLQRILGSQASILRDRGDLDGALAKLRESEKIGRDLGLKSGLQRTLEQLALVLKARGDLDGAISLLKEQERICRDLGIKVGLQVALGNLANILYFRGEVDAAMALFHEQEKICRDLGLKDRLQNSLGGQAMIYRARGDWSKALGLLQEQETICIELGLKGGLQVSLYNQGIIALVRGNLDSAMTLFRKQEEICREAGYKEGLQASFGSQAVIYRNRGNLEKAMALFGEQEKICRSAGYKEGLQIALCGQAAILQARGDIDLALLKLKEGERICRELSHKEGLQRVLCSLSQIHVTKGDHKTAMALLQEVEKICRGLDYKSGLQRALEYQASILKSQGDLDRAMNLLKEQEKICRDLGIKAGLQACIGQQAQILKAKGDFNGALGLLKNQEGICRELGLQAGLARSLAAQAEVLSQKMDRAKEAVSLVNNAFRLAKNHGLTALSNQIQEVLKSVQMHMKPTELPIRQSDWRKFQARLAEKFLIWKELGDLNAAREKLRTQERLCRELEMPEELANCFACQAQIARELKDFETALKLNQEEEKIRRNLEDKAPLAEALILEALLLAIDLNRPREALKKAEEAYRIAEKHQVPEISQEVLKQLVNFLHGKIA